MVQNIHIVRHNQNSSVLADEAKKMRWIVHHKPLFRTVEGELQKPNLNFVKDQKAMMIDVTVRFKRKRDGLRPAANSNS